MAPRGGGSLQISTVQKMTLLSFSAVDTFGGRPYNPPTADEAARQKAPTKQQPLERTKQLALPRFRVSDLPKVENRVLTDENVSNTTRPVDDAERQPLPLSAILKGQTCCRATGKRFCSPEFGSSGFHRRRPDPGTRGQLFDIVKMEERETWTARFLRNLPSLARSGFNRHSTVYVSYRGIQQSARQRAKQLCVLVNSKRADVDLSQISNLRV